MIIKEVINLKRLIFFIALVIFSLNLIAPVNAATNTGITVKVDGKVVSFPDAKPCTENGRTFVPVRFVATALSATVDWISSSGTVVIKKASKEIRFKSGDNKATVNGKEIILDVKFFSRNGRTFVPLRFISETLGTTVDWFGDSKMVVINNTDKGIVSLYDRLLQSGEYVLLNPNNKKDMTIKPKDSNYKIHISKMEPDEVDGVKIAFGDISIRVFDYSKYTRSKLKNLLSVCYPKQYTEAYHYFMQTLREELWEHTNGNSLYPGINDIYLDNKWFFTIKDTNNGYAIISVGIEGTKREKDTFRYKLNPGKNPYIQEEIDKYHLDEE